MFLVLVNMLVVLVARENAVSLGAPTTVRLLHTRLPEINSTATQTEEVPAIPPSFQDTEKTDRKVSQNRTTHRFPLHFQDQENKVKMTQLTTHQYLQNNDSTEFSAAADATATEGTAFTVYDFQSSTMQERSFEELLNRARMKYLGHDLSYKTSTSRTSESLDVKLKTPLSSQRKTIIERNKQRSILHAGFGSSRWRTRGIKVADTGTTQTQKLISMKNSNEHNNDISTAAKVQIDSFLNMDLAINGVQIKPMMEDQITATHAPTTMPETGVTIHNTIGSDESGTELDSGVHTARPATGEDVKYPPQLPEDNSPLGKRGTNITDMFQLMNADKGESAISLHHGRSLMHQSGYLTTSIQNIHDTEEGTVVKVASVSTKQDAKVTIPNVELSESSESYDGSEGSGNEVPFVFDGQYHEVEPAQNQEVELDQYHEVEPGQYHEVEPGQYHEVEPGQYHEVNPGQYHELDPGQYHETDPGEYHEMNPGQEVQLNIEYNPQEETKTYNVHKKTGDYIIGEMGKINVNNGQTLEGVRYTAVDGMVDQAQIAEILRRFFGTN